MIDEYFIENWKECVCSLYCGNTPKKCKRKCKIKHIDRTNANKYRLNELFDFIPTDEATALAKRIRLHKEYQEEKERKRIKNNGQDEQIL